MKNIRKYVRIASLNTTQILLLAMYHLEKGPSQSYILYIYIYIYLHSYGNILTFLLELNYRLIKKEREKQREKLRKRQNSVPNENMLLKNLAKLQNIRIIQKELVYVIGLSPSLASDKVINIYIYIYRFFEGQSILGNMVEL